MPVVSLVDLFTAAKGYLRSQNLQELLLGTCPCIILKLVKSSEKSRWECFMIILCNVFLSLAYIYTTVPFSEKGCINLTLFSAQHDWVWTGLGLDASSRKAREKIQNTSQGRYNCVEYLYAWFSCISYPDLNWHVQSVCRSIKMTGKGLQVWVVRARRQGSSWLVLVPYQMDFFYHLTAWWSFPEALYNRQVSLTWKRVVHRGFLPGSSHCIHWGTNCTEPWLLILFCVRKGKWKKSQDSFKTHKSSLSRSSPVQQFGGVRLF